MILNLDKIVLVAFGKKEALVELSKTEGSNNIAIGMFLFILLSVLTIILPKYGASDQVVLTDVLNTATVFSLIALLASFVYEVLIVNLLGGGGKLKSVISIFSHGYAGIAIIRLIELNLIWLLLAFMFVGTLKHLYGKTTGKSILLFLLAQIPVLILQFALMGWLLVAIGLTQL